MAQAVQRHGLALRYGPEAIRNDPELAYAAVKCSWRAMRHVSEALRSSSRIAAGPLGRVVAEVRCERP